MLDLKIINGNCFINGKLEKQDIGIKQGKIADIGSSKEESKETFNAENLTVLPGCIDTQVHFREPGSTDTEDLNSGSKAAVMGGITSVFEMPNTKPPTTNFFRYSNIYNCFIGVVFKLKQSKFMNFCSGIFCSSHVNSSNFPFACW